MKGNKVNEGTKQGTGVKWGKEKKVRNGDKGTGQETGEMRVINKSSFDYFLLFSKKFFKNTFLLFTNVLRCTVSSFIHFMWLWWSNWDVLLARVQNVRILRYYSGKWSRVSQPTCSFRVSKGIKSFYQKILITLRSTHTRLPALQFSLQNLEKIFSATNGLRKKKVESEGTRRKTDDRIWKFRRRNVQAGLVNA